MNPLQLTKLSKQPSSIKEMIDDIGDQIKGLRKYAGQKNMIRPVKKIHPSEETYGYRWVQSKTGRIYIVTIRIDGDYWHDPHVNNMLDYITDRCTILSIEDIETGEKVKDIGYVEAFFQSDTPYCESQKIENIDTWFCLSKEQLLLSQGQMINNVMKKEFIPLDR